jgi:hypothetical protein
MSQKINKITVSVDNSATNSSDFDSAKFGNLALRLTVLNFALKKFAQQLTSGLAQAGVWSRLTQSRFINFCSRSNLSFAPAFAKPLGRCVQAAKASSREYRLEKSVQFDSVAANIENDGVKDK